MITSGFTNAPVSRILVMWVVIGALLAAQTDTRYYLHIEIVPHIWLYGQFWRFLTWQISFTNSTEVLFASMTFYQLRVIERLWGSRKFASFLISILPYTTLLPPLLLALVLRPLTFGRLNYLPSGPTPMLFALLAQYYATIPSTYKYRLTPYSGGNTASSGSSRSTATGNAASVWSKSITLTSKSTSYLLPLQLALSQLPGSLLAAAVGWAVGMAYRRDLLPYAATFRVPAWVVGEQRVERGFEGLRRRLEGEREREEGLTTGILAGENDTRPTQRRGRRTLGQLIAEQFRGRG